MFAADATQEVPSGVLLPLLHATALLLFPAMMGLSTTMCLASSPSPYSIVAVHEYVSRTRLLDRLWLVASFAWLVVAAVRGTGAAAGAPSPTGFLLLATAASTALVTVAVHLWYQVTIGAELTAARERVEQGPSVTRENGAGLLVAKRREGDASLSLASAPRGTRLYLVVMALAVGAFVAVSVALGAFGSFARFLQCLLVAGFYCSIGVFFVDLIQDCWPGTTTKERLAIASRYYVQVFEQWVNYGVLISFLIVLVGAPLAWASGYVPFAAIMFPVWIASCLCFATFFNQVLRPRGVVESRLPLPVYVNEYSALRPLWAHFFTVIHIVMWLTLVVGLIAVSGTLG